MIAFIGVAATLGVFGCLVLAVVSKLRGRNAKIPLLWAAVCVALVAFMASFETDKPAEATEPPPDAPEAVEAQEPADSAEPAQNDTETPPEPVTEPEPQDNAITLVAGEKGLYGEWFTMNEEAFYIYRVPAGVYRVTNAGEYPTQASVYKGVIRNEETGFDEYSASGDVAWMDVGGSKEITVPEGWFIGIHEPTKITLVRTGDAPTPEPEPAPEPEPEPVKEPEPEPEPEKPSLTMGQLNALGAAKVYLATTAFSHDGLVGQLEYSGYETADAVYAADNCGADWNEQAAKKAENYLETSALSYSGLIKQLEYEKFTTEQATYGADNCGADWAEQAVKKGAEYLSISPFSRDGLIQQLEFDGFTHEQAEYGATQNGY